MGRGGTVGSKQDFKKRVRSKDKGGSDDSDEDYVISDEGDEVSEDELEDYCSPVDGYDSEEGFDNFVDKEEEEEEDEDEEEEVDVKKVVRSKARKSNLWNEKNGVKMVRKRKRVMYSEDEDEDEDEDYEEEEEEEEDEVDVKKVVRSKARKSNLWNEKNGVKTARKRKRVTYSEDEDEDYEEEEEVEEEEVDVKKVVGSKARKSKLWNGKNGVKMARKRTRVMYGEDEDEDYEEEEDEDEEFTSDEDDCLDVEEELVVTKKKSNNLSRKGTRKKGYVRGRTSRKSKVSKKPSGKKGRSRGLRRKQRSNDDEDDCIDLIDDMVVVKEKSKKDASRKRRRYVFPPDSDFASSGPSDYEYTISEEGREQVKEANQLCGGLKTSLRNSSSSKIIEEDGNLHRLKKTLGRKGKEKIQEVKSEVAKQVCGICLSEEDKRRLRGTLNCCSHFFCFTCIMEWSKVESRCPLCKQRFRTITKPERSTAGVDLRRVVIPVPERDQVYQPSEEDLRSFLDPYENVICSECHQGGDDGLMLLCDSCDSPAHTYCVGLGRVVPEGNWYCDGCRPVALGSSSSQAQDPLHDQRTTTTNLYNRPSPFVSFGEGFNPYSVSSPLVPLTPGSGNLSAPRFTVGDVQAASPGSGAGAPTLSGRRWIHRHIQNLLSMNRMNFTAGSTDGMPTANLSSEILNSQVDQVRETVVQPARAQETEPLHQAIIEERLPDHPTYLVENGGLFATRLNLLGRQAVQDPTITTANGSVNLTLWPELAGISSLPSFEQHHQCSGISNFGTGGCVSPFTSKDEFDFNVAKEKLQSVVKSHLKNLSRDIELDSNNFKDIARSSTHTILAACGLEHRRTEVHIVPPPSICSHVERSSGQTSLMKGHCSSCFDSFVRDVVKRIMDTRLPQWLSLGL